MDDIRCFRIQGEVDNDIVDMITKDFHSQIVAIGGHVQEYRLPNNSLNSLVPLQSTNIPESGPEMWFDYTVDDSGNWQNILEQRRALEKDERSPD